MPKLPRITGKDLVAALQKDGFEIARQKGSHVQLKKRLENGDVTFPVPGHAGKIIKQGTLRGILRKANMSPGRLEALLRL